MKKLSIILVVALLLSMIPMAASAQTLMGTQVLFYCRNGGRPSGTATLGSEWSSIRSSTGNAYFLLRPGTYSLYYNGTYAGRITAGSFGRRVGVYC